MNQNKTIQVYEHQKLAIGDKFQEKHRKALLKLNERHAFHYLEATSNGVKFKNYVGIVQVDELIIEILPKIDYHERSDINWQNVLLDMLKVSKNLEPHEVGDASVKKRNNNLLDVYLDLFLKEIESLLKRGLSKQYRLHTSNTLALKGKLELAGHIKNNLVHKERFYTTHQVYDHQHLIHKILRKALNIVVDITLHGYLSPKAKRALLYFPEVNIAHITIQSFNKIKLNKKTKQYQKALKLARVIIENYSPSIRTGQLKMLALMFNMNTLWEQYLFQVIKKGEFQGKYKISKPSKPLLHNQAYRLQPDMFVEFKDGRKLIIDAKWKVPKNQKASIPDLRQIYTYNHFWKASHGVLLYPGSQDPRPWMIFQDQTKLLQCKLYFINILDANGELNKEIDMVKRLDIPLKEN